MDCVRSIGNSDEDCCAAADPESAVISYVAANLIHQPSALWEHTNWSDLTPHRTKPALQNLRF